MSTMTEPRYRIEDVQDFLDDLEDMNDDRTRRMHLVENYPHIPPNFWKRTTPSMILALDPWALVAAIGYPDPTGETAARNVDRERAA